MTSLTRPAESRVPARMLVGIGFRIRAEAAAVFRQAYRNDAYPRSQLTRIVKSVPHSIHVQAFQPERVPRALIGTDRCCRCV